MEGVTITLCVCTLERPWISFYLNNSEVLLIEAMLAWLVIGNDCG